MLVNERLIYPDVCGEPGSVSPAVTSVNHLYFGNNWDWLQLIEPDSVDLVYLDPPFNSKAQYNLLYETPDNERETAQHTVFRDTWTWTTEAEFCLNQCIAQGGKIAGIMRALNSALQRSDTMAYLAMMAARLVLIHRTLKLTGSLYLHCDPTASHYLKIILDAIFGPVNYRTEISWRRTSAHSDAKQGRRQYGNVRDVIFFYTSTGDWTWNWQYTPYDQDYVQSEYRHMAEAGAYKETDVTAAKPGGDTSYSWRVKRPKGRSRARWAPDFDDEYRAPKAGWEYRGVPPYRGRFWAYSRDNLRKFWEQGVLVHRATGMPRLMQFVDEMPGVALQNDWQDIPPAPRSEALGYPTQKPLALLRRIIETSSNPGDVVLDPFCGCGTSVHAAAELKRQWIGIDVSYYAIRLIRRRLQANFGSDFAVPIEGIPADLASAEALAERDPYGFQQWAVHELGCQLWNDGKKGADKGIDGEMWFYNGPGREAGRLLVQVKGGKKTVDQVRAFKTVLDDERAELGIFFGRGPATPEMTRIAASAGRHRIGSREIDRFQIFPLEAWFKGQRPDLPTPVAVTIPKDKLAAREKRVRRPDPSQPEFYFGIEGKKELVKGQIVNPDVLPDDAFRADDVA
jgi:DNA modification methylase